MASKWPRPSQDRCSRLKSRHEAAVRPRRTRLVDYRLRGQCAEPSGGAGAPNQGPAAARAQADIRALENADLDLIEAQLRESIKDRLIPDTTVELEFRRGRPAFVANNVSRVLAQHAQGVFKEMGLPMVIRDRATGGGTDAAYAGMRPKGGVLESFGLRGYGSHSNDNEYIFISSIAPKLVLATRMVMDVGSGVLKW